MANKKGASASSSSANRKVKAGSGKQAKRFAAKGHLARTIKERRQRQQVSKRRDDRQALRRNGVSKDAQLRDDDDDDEEPELDEGDVEAQDLSGDEDIDGADSDISDQDALDALFADAGPSTLGGRKGKQAQIPAFDDEEEDDDEEDLEDLEGEEEKHKLSLASLRERDPEFYKYLEENDKALLDFGEDGIFQDSDAEAGDKGRSATTSKQKKGKSVVRVDKEMLKSWQRQMLQQRSLKALRKVLLAFRTAATQDEDAEDTAEKRTQQSMAQRYEVPSAVIFNKLVVTALKYTPLVLNHHVPVKEQANGKVKVPTHTKKYSTAQRVVKSYFASLLALLSTLSGSSTSASSDLIHLSIVESSRLIPYLVGNRKASRAYLRLLLELWGAPGPSSTSDAVRLAAFLALRRMALTGDVSTHELVLRGTYLTLQAASKQTNVYTLPALNLMKNSASGLFTIDPARAYQLGFGYIRQLAVALRNAMKVAPKTAKKTGKKSVKATGNGSDPHQAVYNWTIAHSVDFWSLVLSAACGHDSETISPSGVDSDKELRPLIYPVVQVALGLIRLVPTSRYFPFRFQLITSLLRVMQRTGTYIPIAPLLMEVLDSAELSSNRKPKHNSSLKPLDFAYYVRAPAAYPRTRVYADGLVEEIGYLLLEFFATQSTSIAFLELAIPVTVALKRHIRKSKNTKLVSALRQLCERIDSNASWITEKREQVDFAPQSRQQVTNFMRGEENSPLRSYLKLQRKIRDQKRETLEKILIDDEQVDSDGAEEDDAEMSEDQ